MTEAAGIVVHHLETSRSQRILWLLEELEVPYTVKYYKRLPTKLAPPELKKVHPLGKSPIITDGDVTLAESGAIVAYLLTKYGNGKGQPPPEGVIDDLYYKHYAEGSLMPLLVWKNILSLAPDRAPFVVRPVARSICNSITSAMITPGLQASMDMVDNHLSKNPGKFFAGGATPTASDYMMFIPMEISKDRVEKEYIAVKAWVDMVHASPAYQRALEKGGD